MKRNRVLFFFLCLFACLLLGCGQSQSSDLENQWVSALSAQDFESAYACLWPHGDLPTKEKFTQDFQSLMQAFSANAISLSDVQQKEENGLSFLCYTMTYESPNYGKLSFPCQLRIVSEGGKKRLLYQGDLVAPDFTPGDSFRAAALSACRGEIFTADGVVIAQNSFSDTVYLDLTTDFSLQDCLTKLSSLLDLSQKQIEKIRNDYASAQENHYSTVVCTAFPKNSISEELESQLLAIPGVAIDRNSLTPQRYYPFGKMYAHITGYANSPTEEELADINANGYSPQSVYGKAGLELAYNADLMGKDGIRLFLMRDGQIKKILFEAPAENGKDLHLTISHALQQKAYYAMVSHIKSDQTGVILSMDSTNAFLTAMVSCPSYDPNVFSFSLSKKEQEALFSESSGKPLLNRATQGLYPPGSSIKPFSIMPALENGTINRNSVFPYPIIDGAWTPEDETWIWPSINSSSKEKNPLNLYNAMVESNNIYFAWAALELGEEKFLDFYQSIGIGERIPFDLPTAKSNLLNEKTEMNRKLLSDMAFGHGELLLTPLQVASMYTVFSADGNIMAPKIVHHVAVQKGNVYETVSQTQPEIWKEAVVSKSTLSIIKKTLHGVVEEGTAQRIRIKGMNLSAKTGVALKGAKKETEDSWLVGWWEEPKDGEQRLALVLIEGPRNNSSYKMDVMRTLLTPE